MLPKFVLAAACLALVQATFIVRVPKESRNRDVENENTIDADLLNIDVNAEMSLIEKNTAQRTVAENTLEPRRGCNAQTCDLNCRAMRYHRGICIISRCQCLGRPIRSEVSERSTAPASVSSCDATKCEDGCSSMGFPGGECVDSRCKCDIPSIHKPAPIPELLSTRASLSDCNLRWCEQNCRRIGFPGGVCVGDRCKCDILSFLTSAPSTSSRYASPDVVGKIMNVISDDNVLNIGEPSTKDLSDPPASLGSCTNAVCAAFCSLHGYPHGICISDNQCLCYR